MAALTDLSDLINRMSGGSSGTPATYWVNKPGRVAGAAATAPTTGRTISLWQYDGTYGAGSAPTSVEVPTRTTPGAIPLPATGSGRERWLTQVFGASSTAGMLILVDRLLHIGGLSGTSTADQTVQGASPSVVLTRNTGGVGNIAFYEIYATVGGTGTTLTMTYTDDAGNSGQTSTINFGAVGFRETQRIQAIPLAAGDLGVRAVEKVKLTATTATAGNFGITIARPLAYVPIGLSGGSGWRDFTTGLPSIPKIDDDACLQWLWVAGSTTVPDIWAGIAVVEK